MSSLTVGWGVRQWEKNKVSRFTSTINTWFSYLLWVQNRFQIENRLKFRELPLDFQKFFPIEIFFSKNFKIIVESCQIAHSIGNFILKNVITGHFLIKWTCEEIWRHFLIFSDFVTSYMNRITYDVISHHMFTLSKMSRFKVF